MPSPALHTLFRKESFSPSEQMPEGAFCACTRKNLSVTPTACHLPYRGEALAYRKASPLRQRLPYKGSCRGACDETERLYEGEPDREQKPLPKEEPSDLHDSALLRWNKWQSSYKINDTSLNIGCLPTWQSSPPLAKYLLCQQGTSLPPWPSSFYGVGTMIFWNFAR